MVRMSAVRLGFMFLLGAVSNAIAWRLDKGEYDTIVFPIAMLVVTVIAYVSTFYVKEKHGR